MYIGCAYKNTVGEFWNPFTISLDKKVSWYDADDIGHFE